MREKNKPLRYEKPPLDPLERRMERKFSVTPQAVDAVKTLKARIAKQRNVSKDNIYVSPQMIVEELKPFLLSRKLGETEGNYTRRALERGMLTDTEVKFLIQQELGYLGTSETKEKMDAHEKRLRELRDEEYANKGQMVEMRPYLVNISWVYSGTEGRRGRRGSPAVKYSIEGVFYGWDMETTMEAAREFLTDNVSDTSSYKAKAIMDIAEFDVSAQLVSDQSVGAMEVSGDSINKRYGDTIADDRFNTKVNAFFQNPSTRRVYVDREFGYRDSTLKYRWVGKRIVAD